MQTYDAFAARVSARGDGGGDARAIGPSGDRSSNPRPSTSRDAALLATLPECYDAYVALHRGGLWFDINPFWHPELRCYYFRCEPNRTTISTHAARDPPAIGDASGDAENVATRKPQSRRRAVIVPVAASRGSVSHRELRRVARLGDQWARETEQNEHERVHERDERDERGDGTSEAPSPSVLRECREPADGETDDRSNVAREPTPDESALRFDGFRGDDPPAITTSLCVVDTDGVAVVLRVARGLVEPEEVDLPPKEEGDADNAPMAFANGAFAEDAGERVPTSASGAIADRGASGFSDDEDDLDERDAGDVGGEQSRG